MNQNFIYRLLAGFNNETSSKRFLMLWIGIVIWSFIHVMVFLLIRPFPADFARDLVLYDVILLTGLAGLNVSEKIWGKKDTTGQTPPEQK